jgi:hypothetical protein
MHWKDQVSKTKGQILVYALVFIVIITFSSSAQAAFSTQVTMQHIGDRGAGIQGQVAICNTGMAEISDWTPALIRISRFNRSAPQGLSLIRVQTFY